MAIDKIVAEYRLELDGLRNDIAEVKRNLSTVDDSIKKSTEQTSAQLDSIGKQASGKLSSAFNTLGKTIIAAFAVERIGAFLTSTIQLAKEAEEVKSAFDRLNNPALLSQLRKATEGTLSDLKLMGLALKADKLQVPMSKFADILKFAKLRADELGSSTESLVETLVQGIGTKSTRALVAVGISQEQFGAEVKKTGDYFTALNKIMTDTLKNAGEGFDSAADKTDRLQASIENTKVEIGTKLLPVVDELLTGINDAIKGFDRLFNITSQSEAEGFDRIIEMFSDGSKPAEGFAAEIADVSAQIAKLNKEYESQGEQKSFNTSLVGIIASLGSSAKKTRDYSKTLGLLTGQLKALQALQAQENRESKRSTEIVEEQTTANSELTKELQKRIPLLAFLLDVAQDSALPIQTYGIDVDKTADAILKASENALKLKDSLGVVNGVLLDTEPTETATAQWEDYANALLSIFDSINTAYTNGSNYRLSILENELEQGVITQKAFDKKKKDILHAEAVREKAFSILSITLSTARAVMAALATVPPNPALALLAGITGAVQLGVAAGAPIPAFKEGVIDLKGKGTGTSDSNIALLSKGESVMTAKETQKYKPVLEAIRKDRFEEYIQKTYIKQLQQKRKDEVLSWDDQRLLHAMYKTIYSDKENTKQIVGAIREQRKEHRFR